MEQETGSVKMRFGKNWREVSARELEDLLEQLECLGIELGGGCREYEGSESLEHMERLCQIFAELTSYGTVVREILWNYKQQTMIGEKDVISMLRYEYDYRRKEWFWQNRWPYLAMQRRFNQHRITIQDEYKSFTDEREIPYDLACEMMNIVNTNSSCILRFGKEVPRIRRTDLKEAYESCMEKSEFSIVSLLKESSLSDVVQADDSCDGVWVDLEGETIRVMA
ncbi:MAG: hypothetical protein ACI4HI_10040 [Lachnospiraceae bacterium]